MTPPPDGPSSIEARLPGRARDLGEGFVVRRVLPHMTRRHLGPYVFLDHMGPVALAAGQGMDVRPHPHIGLSTLTYLFEGEIVHKDSLGSDLAIRPGAVNWMTAGRGIVHSERSSASARVSGAHVHGLQLWVALPSEREEDEPSFQHHPADTIPEIEQPGVLLHVVAGSAFGHTSPVETSSDLFFVEARLEQGREVPLPGSGERGAYVVEGRVQAGGQLFGAGELLVARPGAQLSITAADPARIVLLGGDSVGQRHLFWNFVSSSAERIERAKRDWIEHRFAAVPGDAGERIELPAQ